MLIMTWEHGIDSPSRHPLLSVAGSDDTNRLWVTQNGSVQRGAADPRYRDERSTAHGPAQSTTRRLAVIRALRGKGALTKVWSNESMI